MMAAQQTFAFLTEVPPLAEAPVPEAGTVDSSTAHPQEANSQEAHPHPLKAGVRQAIPDETSPRESVLRQLRRQAGCVSTAPTDDTPTMSTGCPSMDRYLPRGGLRVDAINEWLSASGCSGASVLAIIAAATHLNSHDNRFDVSGPLVVVDKEGTFYPPAAVALGIPAQKIILVRPQNHADHVWAIDQALRCESVAAVWSPIGKQLGDRDARRFQLAAEKGKTPGFLVRPSSVRGCPTFADVRLHSEPISLSTFNDPPHRPTLSANHATLSVNHTASAAALSIQKSMRLKVTIDRCRGGTTGQSIPVQIDDRGQLQRIERHTMIGQTEHHETATMHLASRLAHPAAAQSRADTRNDSRRRRA